MSKARAKVLEDMRRNPKNIRFSDLCRVCEHFFGPHRQSGGSHRLYSVSLKGRPPIDIQEGENGKAEAYQVKQVLQTLVDLGLI